MKEQNSIQESANKSNIINTHEKKNRLGTTGFIIALIALFFGWVPYLGWLIWVLGLVLSFVGVFKKPKKLSIAGILISLIGIFLIIIIDNKLGGFHV